MQHTQAMLIFVTMIMFFLAVTLILPITNLLKAVFSENLSGAVHLPIVDVYQFPFP